MGLSSQILTPAKLRLFYPPFVLTYSGLLHISHLNLVYIKFDMQEYLGNADPPVPPKHEMTF
eukprot:scaffold2479_cov151-Amphora_coffeaeformis.AAC.5